MGRRRVDPSPPVQTGHISAVAAVQARVRRQWAWYAPVLGCVLVGLVVGVCLVHSRGERGSVTSQISSTPAQPIPLSAVSATLREVWASPDSTAAGAAVHDGTVVTFSDHTVTGREAGTGRVRWFYRRGDRTVCAVHLAQNRAFAVFSHDGNCDELTALDVDTGQLVWARTLDENGRPLNGTPTVSSTGDTVFVSSRAVVYALSISDRPCRSGGSGCGTSYWTLPAPDGCSIASLMSTDAGVLIAEHCEGYNELVLRDRYASGTDQNSQIRWTTRTAALLTPLATGTVPAAYDASARAVKTYDASTGATTRTISLRPVPGGASVTSSVTNSGHLLISIGPTTYAVALAAGVVRWSITSPRLPQPSAAAGSDLYLIEGVSVVQIDARTGRTARTQILSGMAPNAQDVERLGSGFLVAGPVTAVYA